MEDRKIDTKQDAYDIIIEAMSSDEIMSKFSLVYYCEIEDKKYVILYDIEEEIDAVFELEQSDEYNDFIVVEDEEIIDAVCMMYYNELDDDMEE